MAQSIRIKPEFLESAPHPKKKLHFLIVFLFLGCLLYWGNRWATHSYLGIKHIQIRNHYFIPIELFRKECAPFFSKNGIWLWLFGQARRDLLRNIPQLSHVSISIDFPNTLIIRVKEKEPFISSFIEGKSYILSKEGAILNVTVDEAFSSSHSLYSIPAPSEPYLDKLKHLIIIKGLPASSVSGHWIMPQLMRTILRVVDTVAHKLPNREFQIEFEGENDLTLLVNDALPVQIGDLTNIEYKMTILNAFLNYLEIEKKTVDYIDLRVSNKIFVKFS